MTVSTTQDKKRNFIFKAAAVIFWLAVWQFAAMWLKKEILLVSPLAVIRTLFELAGEGEYWSAVLYSFVRILSGFFIALLSGTVFGVLASKLRFLRELLAPLMFVIKATPVASFIIIALIWISSAKLSIFIAFLMVLPIVYTNVLNGMMNTDKGLREMAAVFRLSPLKKAVYIYIPQLMPFFISACTVSLGLCWKAGIAAEVIGLPTGSLGERLYQAKIYLETPELFAWTVTIIIVSIAFEKLFLFLLRQGYRILLRSRK